MTDLRDASARTLKWNVVDRVASQVLYAVTGIVLARLLTQAEFGLVGAILIFQAFASLMVDSGLSYALLQRKDPTRGDYSSVLWFNIGTACALYAVLWALAPWIAELFRGSQGLVPLARVMFLTFILNAASIVQVNRLMKRMDVRMVAVANTAGLAAGAVVGIWMAVDGWGAWAIVWQAVAVAAVKTALLWATGGWTPAWTFSWRVIRGFWGIGGRMMATSALNTLFQYIYSFFIGNRVGMVSLGYYTQADKWSKMGVMSLSQVLTATFLPVLSAVQDQRQRFVHILRRVNRLSAYLVFPALGILAAVAAPTFHVLFGHKWDASIVLFQLLLLRGLAVVMCLLYNNYMLALGHARAILRLEVVRDAAAVVALVVTLPCMAWETPEDPVLGVRVMLWGQVAATMLTWALTLWRTARVTGLPVGAYVRDMAPYAVLTLGVMGALWTMEALWPAGWPAWTLLGTQCAAGAALYVGCCAASGSAIQRDALQWLLKRNKG